MSAFGPQRTWVSTLFKTKADYTADPWDHSPTRLCSDNKEKWVVTFCKHRNPQ